jgi:hypothetical protein
MDADVLDLVVLDLLSFGLFPSMLIHTLSVLLRTPYIVTLEGSSLHSI